MYHIMQEKPGARRMYTKKKMRSKKNFKVLKNNNNNQLPAVDTCRNVQKTRSNLIIIENGRNHNKYKLNNKIRSLV